MCSPSPSAETNSTAIPFQLLTFHRGP
jgi:hypothetical protein